MQLGINLWRDHRPNEIVCIAARDVIDQRLRAGERGIGGGVAVGIRASLRVVHRDLADEGAQPSLQADVDQELVGALVDGAVHHGSRGAVGGEIIKERLVGAPCEAKIGIPGLERKGVTRQPIRERAIKRLPKLRILRGVDVKIDQSGEHVGPCGDRQERAGGDGLGAQPRIIGLAASRHRRDGAGRIHGKQRIFEDVDGAARGRMKEGSRKHASAHVIHRIFLAISSYRFSAL